MVKRLISAKQAEKLKEKKQLEAGILAKLEKNCGFTKKEAQTLLRINTKELGRG